MTEEVEYLVEGRQSPDPGNMGPLFEWLPQQIWPRIKALEGLKRYAGIYEIILFVLLLSTSNL